MKKLATLVPIFALLVGCGKGSHDEAYYEEHAAERNAKVKECNVKPDGGVSDGDCVAALAVVKKHISTGAPVYVNGYTLPTAGKK